MNRYTDSPIEADSRVEHPVKVSEGDGALGFLVYEEGEGVLVQVEQNADGGSHVDAALDSLFVGARMLEPGTLSVNVHGPALVVLS